MPRNRMKGSHKRQMKGLHQRFAKVSLKYREERQDKWLWHKRAVFAERRLQRFAEEINYPSRKKCVFVSAIVTALLFLVWSAQ